MIAAEWMLCARGASIDRDSGALTVFGIADAMKPSEYPFAIQQMSVVCRVKRQETDGAIVEAKLRITLNGKILFETPFVLDFESKPSSNLVIGLNGLVVPAPGEVQFSLLLGSRTLVKTSFSAIQLEPVLTKETATAPADGKGGKKPRPVKKAAKKKLGGRNAIRRKGAAHSKK
jgi:hypothetical protein